jgi:superfamily II DNA or RNA helicase
VKVRVGSSTELGAEVKGSEPEPYAITLKWSEGKLAVLCTCPHFMDQGQNCKHLWAAILIADEDGYLGDAKAALKIVLDSDSLMDELDDGSDRLDGAPSTFLTRPAQPPKPPPPAKWKRQLDQIAGMPVAPETHVAPWPTNSELLYILDIEKSRAKQAIVLTIGSRTPLKQGGWKYNQKPIPMQRARIPSLPTETDREILTRLMGAGQYNPYSASSYDPYDQGRDTFSIPPALAEKILPVVLATGRCFLPFDKDEPETAPLRWDDGEPWRLTLEMSGSEAAGWLLTGGFRRGEQRMALGEPRLIVKGGFLVANGAVAQLVEDQGFPWIAALRENGTIAVPEQDREEFMSRLLCLHRLPALELPEPLRYEEVTIPPRPCLTISRPKSQYGADRLHGVLSFAYEGLPSLATTPARGIYDAANRRFLRRDLEREQAAAIRLSELGLRPVQGGWQEPPGWHLAPTKLPRVARSLIEAGWQVVAEGKLFRSPGQTSVSIASGLDWFELHGTVAYGDTTAQLPQLLSAFRRGETMVVLDDGSYGLLPEEWLRRFGNVAAMGDAEGDHIQFRRSQAGLLDALLSAEPAVDCDEQFRHVRRELGRFQSVAAAEQPAGFTGQLREYQREGLGWMHFLRQFSFGGCLADDMGVGKTAQVLALVETRRELRVKGEIDAPSLAVVPKSLIFNWKQEIERFTPQVRVLDYTGIARSKDDFAAYDLILTTYGTLRRDAVHFRAQVFDYLILDEAQAIKNAKTESAKAVRLLRGNHRLALSGTPIENHLGELWSLFEFLNPGMLGASSVFQSAAKDMRDAGDESRKLLSRAVRPFLLRRTKEQVAKELPAKVEQTVFCELEPPQRKLYNELREHYRDALLQRIDKVGIAKSKIQVLEALLRLRQAACHPGLIDKTRASDSSAKLDVLIDQLRDVIEEGHKALVFSQFTTLLALAGKDLAAEGMEYEYLDGKTVDRQARVERFQNDPKCRLFLISLKAGGVGLNLTAADYVFILDPWWNPAVEAQAVDRAHRIGQMHQVFAYRLIARDTVEEKILQLQQSKRHIADAILGEDNSLIQNLAPADIELLLS